LLLDDVWASLAEDTYDDFGLFCFPRNGTFASFL
jgi:hypothetical protein